MNPRSPAPQRQPDRTDNSLSSSSEHPAYLLDGVERIKVPSQKIPWEASYPEYDQAIQEPYTHGNVLQEFLKNGESGWADAPTKRATPENTTSYHGELATAPTGEVLNPGGRTGIKDGRGLLGKFGPNFAADPVLFNRNPETFELEVLLIQRGDTDQWALPGGMVDYGERISSTLSRELQEETGLFVSMDDAKVVYQGWVNDPRNTDKAWMETTVATKMLPPDETCSYRPTAGDDAVRAKWMPFDPSGEMIAMYADHAEMIQRAFRALL